MIVFGGEDNGEILKTTEIFNFESDGENRKWVLETEKDLPRPLKNIRGVNINNVIYGIGKTRNDYN